MYTEEEYDTRNRRRGSFPLRDFLLKLILIIIFVLLLVWLVPWPNNKSLTDRIFNANVQEMKNAALLYFTEERLPENVGDKKTITLQEMLDLHLLLPFTDKDGNSCDTQASYVTIEKLEEEFLLKVNLKCGDEEDYILVHVGCYAYCQSYICEKQEEEEETKPVQTPIFTSKPNPTPNPSNPSDTPCPTCPTCPPTPTNNPTPTPPPTNPPTNPPTTPPVTPPPTNPPTNPPTTPPTNPPTNPPTTPPVTPPPTITYEYEYKKSVPAGCVTWGAWSNPIVYVDADGLTFGKWAKLEVEDLGSNYEVVGYRPVTIKTTTQRIVQVGSYTETLCTEYTYVRINNTTYAVTSGGWTDAGYYEGYSAPNDTADTHYEFVRVNWDVCGDTCTNHPYLVYKVYKRTLVQKAANNSDSVSRTCSATTTRTIPLYAIQTTTETYSEKQYVYGYVKRYRYRECATYQEASTQYAWSTSQNDQSLLNQGYTLTGNKRVKSK